MIKECKCNPQIFVEHHGKGKFRLERQGKDYILFARVSAIYKNTMKFAAKNIISSQYQGSAQKFLSGVLTCTKVNIDHRYNNRYRDWKRKYIT